MMLWVMGARLWGGREPRTLEECHAGLYIAGFPATLRSFEWMGALFWENASLFARLKGYEREAVILAKVPFLKGVKDLASIRYK